MLAIYYNVAIQTNHPTTQEVKTMTDNEKIIENINRYLNRMTVKQLRLILAFVRSFMANSPQEQEAEEATN